MSVLNRIAYFQGRRDEVPNQELARDLAASEDRAGIREIAENLWNREPNVRSDCLKVLYEIGYLKPELVAPYAGDFLKLLGSRNNRLVWGGMIGLSTVAGIAADELYPHVAEIQQVMESRHRHHPWMPACWRCRGWRRRTTKGERLCCPICSTSCGVAGHRTSRGMRSGCSWRSPRAARTNSSPCSCSADAADDACAGRRG